jgi:DNA repair exonuclease SbcCD ATPase subunit
VILNKLQINGFGKLKNKNIELHPEMNVITGPNESGKSTISEFIKAMFYGINKNKAGKDFSDVERLKPWDDVDFSGKIDYEIDTKKYSVIREFKNNACKIYDDESNDITKEFNIDKSRGAQFATLHIGVDEETFENSAFVRQANIRVEDSSQKSIVQKLTNIIQSGEEDVSYENLMGKLDKTLIDEVGTLRAPTKPRFINNNEISELEERKNKLIHNRERHSEITEKISTFQDNQKEILKELDEFKKAYNIKVEENTKSIIKKEYEIKEKYNAILKDEQNKIIDEDKQRKLEEHNNLLKEQRKIRNAKIAIWVVSLVIIIISLIFHQYIGAVVGIILGAFSLFIHSRNINQEVEKDINDKLNEVEKRIKELEENEQKTLGKQGDINNAEITNMKNKIYSLEEKQKENFYSEQRLQVEDNTIIKDLDKLIETEEMLDVAYDKKTKLDKKETALTLAIDILSEAYNELKKEVIPDIEIRIKDCIKKTTNGKYVDVVYNDKQGLIVQNTKGELITIDKLSIGTIDQMYLGFRLAVLGKLGNVPILLDETFAYFDNERLENILRTLAEMSKENQIIIFSCSDREINMLNKLGARYNHIKL